MKEKTLVFNLYTYSLFQFLKDIKPMSGIHGVDFCLPKTPDDMFDNWFWKITLIYTEDHIIPLLIGLGYVSDKYLVLRQEEYRKFKMNLLKSRTQKFSMRGFELEGSSVAISGKKYNFVL